MTESNADFPRLHVQAAPVFGKLPVDLDHRLADLCIAFEQATGWPLCFDARLDANVDRTFLWSKPLVAGEHEIGQLGIEWPDEATRDDTNPGDAPRAATALADEIAHLLNEQLATAHALWLREAELAAGVPVISREEDPQRLAQRLEAILRAGAQAVNCQAAAVYLLDAHTKELKLRSAWGMPKRKFRDPPRSLDGATADLEALAGHAVVLEAPELTTLWRPPEAFPSSVCVPVSTPSVPLGTLWVFSQEQRPFSDSEVNLIEIIAGRLAAELERQVLLAESQRANRLKRQAAEAEQLLADQSQRVAPSIDGWSVAGWSHTPGPVGSAFYHWQVRDDGGLAFAIGDTPRTGVTGALVMQSLRSAVRAHLQHGLRPRDVLNRVNADLWAESAGDQTASLICGVLDPYRNVLLLATAGSPAIARMGSVAATRTGNVSEGNLTSDLHSPVRRATSSLDFQILSQPQLPLGMQPEATYSQQSISLGPDMGLVMLNEHLQAALLDSSAALRMDQFLAAFSSAPGNRELAERLNSACHENADLNNVESALIVIRRSN